MEENELGNSHSPYLQQHADNPVAWRMWSEETLRAAKELEKPLFISIGYSTCHWCHVMARESFEDEEVARVLNRAFVPIKVDREERPEIDAFYMDVALKLNGSGGWPLTICATPEGEPFFTATYIPKQSYGGRAGMLELLPEIERLWNEERKRVLDSAGSIIDAVGRSHGQGSSNELPRVGIEDALTRLQSSFDESWGGFGTAPKFPQPHLLLFLLRTTFSNERDHHARRMAETTLDHMRAGGIYDHIGFGFHRYATDRGWKVPHFEKMLYDQAMLLMAYLDAYQCSGNSRYERTARETAEFVLRDMRGPDGGFFSALDAESEGEEGKYYLWSRAEILDILGEAGGEVADFFHVYENGNWTDPVGAEAQHSNILYAEPGRDPAEEIAGWDEKRKVLLRRREKRVAPSMDDKILVDWNSLMIRALARAGRVLDEPAYTESARESLRFIETRMYDEEGGLLHSYRGGHASVRAYLDDYAFLTAAYVELYWSDFAHEFLEKAVRTAEKAVTLFEDEENGGFYLSDQGSSELPLRNKQLFDTASPSGSSIMAENLALLYRITGETRFKESLLRGAAAHAGEIEQAPSGATLFLSALSSVAGEGGRELVIVGDGDEAARMTELVRKRYLPGTVVLRKSSENASRLSHIAPYTEGYRADERTGASAYLCRAFNCSRPVATTEELAELISNS